MDESDGFCLSPVEELIISGSGKAHANPTIRDLIEAAAAVAVAGSLSRLLVRVKERERERERDGGGLFTSCPFFFLFFSPWRLLSRSST